MACCLITGEPLDESTKIEHTILRSLGGQITSREVTSSDFNQKCGNSVDIALADVFKHIFAILAPATISNADPGNVLYTSEDKSLRFYLNNGFSTLANNIIIKGENGKPKTGYSANVENLRLLAKKSSLTISNVEQVALPVGDGIAYRKCRLLHTDIEIAVIKCIATTIDEMTRRGNLQQITRNEKLSGAITLLKKYIIENEQQTSNIYNEINKIYCGIQFKGPAKIDAILRENAITSTPFEHIMIISGNVATKTIDVLWYIAGIEVHGVRLCTAWDEYDFTYVIKNPILKNSPPPSIISLKKFAGVLCEEFQFRSIQSVSNGKTINPFITSMISENRQAGYMEAILYIEKNCDEQVFKEFIEPTKCDTNLTVKQIIFQHFSPLYMDEKILKIWNDIFKYQEPIWATELMKNITIDSSIWDDILREYRRILSLLTPMDKKSTAIFSKGIEFDSK